jgi:hypothetical protein
VKRLARVIAFYLPQFHPIPENDGWWETGFTEWTNVTKAVPLFRGHWQPRLPADLGFYDLRVPEIREQQAQLAGYAAVEGFCYWHYWFGSGRRILERPINEVLASGKPDFPFCFAWANQSWSGIWHGRPNEKLMDQTYPGREDDERHFNLVLPAFRDNRYVTVEGKPLFAIYDPNDHPYPQEFMKHWRMLSERAGLPGIYFVAMWNRGPDPKVDGFDAVTESGPGDYLQSLSQTPLAQKIRRVKQGDFGRKINRLVGTRFLRPRRYAYKDVIGAAFSSDMAKDPRFIPTVLPGWDNTPRSSKRGVVFEGSTPDLFESFLKKALQLVDARPIESRIIFLKAWNEWAEGNYVEPDRKFGRAYLDAIKRVIDVG